MDKAIIGKAGEDYVCQAYKKNGYKILVRNYRTRFGEIDIVVQKKEITVVVEVKARTENTLVPLEYTISPTKQQKIRTAASIYLSANNLMDTVIRFDAALVVHQDGIPISCNIIENAF